MIRTAFELGYIQDPELDSVQIDYMEIRVRCQYHTTLIREQEAVPSGPSLNQPFHHKSRDDKARSIRRALEESRFCKTTAAEKLGMSRTTLWRKLREMEMDWR